MLRFRFYLRCSSNFIETKIPQHHFYRIYFFRILMRAICQASFFLKISAVKVVLGDFYLMSRYCPKFCAAPRIISNPPRRFSTRCWPNCIPAQKMMPRMTIFTTIFTQWCPQHPVPQEPAPHASPLHEPHPVPSAPHFFISIFLFDYVLI